MARFEDAIEVVLRQEGGYVNRADDPGGETKYGITKRDHPTLDVKNLSIEHAKEIYKAGYWHYDGIDDQAVATKVFSLAVNVGVHNANMMLQQAICACGRIIPIDGIVGPRTCAAANALLPNELLATLKSEAVAYYRGLVEKRSNLKVFLKGWLKRATE